MKTLPAVLATFSLTFMVVYSVLDDKKYLVDKEVDIKNITPKTQIKLLDTILDKDLHKIYDNKDTILNKSGTESYIKRLGINIPIPEREVTYKWSDFNRKSKERESLSNIKANYIQELSKQKQAVETCNTGTHNKFIPYKNGFKLNEVPVEVSASSVDTGFSEIVHNVGGKLSINDLGEINHFYKPFLEKGTSHRKQRKNLPDNLKECASVYGGVDYTILGKDFVDSMNKEMNKAITLCKQYYKPKKRSERKNIIMNKYYDYDDVVYEDHLKRFYDIKDLRICMKFRVKNLIEMANVINKSIYYDNIVVDKVAIICEVKDGINLEQLTEDLTHHFQCNTEDIIIYVI